jgi:hypothetical protein
MASKVRTKISIWALDLMKCGEMSLDSRIHPPKQTSDGEPIPMDLKGKYRSMELDANDSLSQLSCLLCRTAAAADYLVDEDERKKSQ